MFSNLMSVALISKTPKVSIWGMLFLIIIFDNKETFYVVLEHDYTWPFPTDIDRKTSLVIFFLNISYLLLLISLISTRSILRQK